MLTVAIITVTLAPVAAGIPPLTDDQRTALMTADDGNTRDHREAAFWALLENTAAWTGEVGDAPIRVQPDFDAMLANPDAYRGELCLVRGRVEHVEPLMDPYEGVEAWFVRVDDGRPVLVYVDFKDREDSRLDFSPTARVEIIARFYKRYERTLDEQEGGEKRAGRDRQVYPVFVGAFPKRAAADAPMTATFSGGGLPQILIPLVAVLGGVFLIVWLWVRRSGSTRQSAVSARVRAASEEPAEAGNLPDDPAEALAVLRDRAQNDR